MATILLTNFYAPGPLEVIRQQLPDGFEILALDRPGKAAIIERVGDADYLLVGGRISIDAQVLQAAKQLRMVQRTGVGLDAVDLDALQVRGIPMYVNPGVNAQCVAEHTLMLMLAALRRLPAVHETLRQGKWVKHELGIRNRDLAGRRVGLVGMGHIGKAVARMLSPFGVTLAYHKPNRLTDAEEHELGLRAMELDDLIVWADVLSLHCPLNTDTRGLLSADRMARMPEGAVLVNTARGVLVDEAALVSALQSGHLAAAGLDVFEQEPLAADSPLRRLDNVVLSPHISGITRDSFQQMMRQAFRNIAAHHAGHLDAIAHLRIC